MLNGRFFESEDAYFAYKARKIRLTEAFLKEGGPHEGKIFCKAYVRKVQGYQEKG